MTEGEGREERVSKKYSAKEMCVAELGIELRLPTITFCGERDVHFSSFGILLNIRKKNRFKRGRQGVST